MKDALERLGPAVRRALADASAAQARVELEHEIRHAHEQTSNALTLLDTLQSKAPVGFGFLDTDLRVTRINRTLAAMSGSTPEEQLGKRLHDAVPLLWPALEPLCARVLAGEPVVNVEMSSPADPHRRSTLLNLYPVRVAGEIVGLGVIVVDITEQKVAAERFRTVIDAMVDPIYLVSPVHGEDAALVDFRIDHANIAAGAQLGRPPDDIAGRTVLEVAPGGQELVRIFQRVVERCEPTSGELTYRGVLGDRGDIEVIADASVVPFDGGVVASFREITERKRAEAAVYRSEERFRSVIQNSSDVILIVDGDGTLRYASPATHRVLGYEPEVMVGTSALDLVHPDDLDLASAALVEAAGTPGVAPGATYRVRHASGEWRWIESIGNNLLADPAIEGIVINARDVTAQRQVAEALADVNRVLRTVTEADAAVVHATSEGALLGRMCRVIVETGGYPLAWIAVPDPSDPDQALPVARYGGAAGYPERVIGERGADPADTRPVAEALATGSTQVIHDVERLTPGLPLREASLEQGYRSQLVLPLVVTDEVIGALSIHSREAGSFDEAEVGLFEQLAGDVAYGVASLRVRSERQQYVDRLGLLLDGLVGTVAAAVEARDPFTAGHQRRVAELAVAIAAELELDEHEIAGIRVAAGMHDIGKISIPSEILTKPGMLSALEFELIKQHARAGHDIVRGIDFPWPVARMILEHHERMDGSGYPSGLRGPELLHGSCIIAVADTVEAMASHRPYRPARGIGAALAQIEHDRGTLFAVDAVDACVRLFHERGFVFHAA
jgi:PAS domain S-box-containing protein